MANSEPLIKLLANKSDVLLTIVATFSFTMLGFLITALAVIVALHDKPYVKSYTKYGYFHEFGLVYIATLISLLICFTLSLISVVYKDLIPTTLSILSVNIFQIIIISISSYRLIFKN